MVIVEAGSRREEQVYVWWWRGSEMEDVEVGTEEMRFEDFLEEGGEERGVGGEEGYDVPKKRKSVTFAESAEVRYFDVEPQKFGNKSVSDRSGKEGEKNWTELEFGLFRGGKGEERTRL